MRGKYFTTNYFQKSKNFLFPLICSNKVQNVETYLMCDGIDEDITEYNLLCKCPKGEDMGEDFLKSVINVYEYDKFDIYILDLTNWKEDVESFLKGEYSKFSKEGRGKILKEFGYEQYPVKETKGYYHFYVYFFPDKYKKEVAKELWEVHGLFNTYEEAYSVIKDMKELCQIYNSEKETLKL